LVDPSIVMDEEDVEEGQEEVCFWKKILILILKCGNRKGIGMSRGH